MGKIESLPNAEARAEAVAKSGRDVPGTYAPSISVRP